MRKCEDVDEKGGEKGCKKVLEEVCPAVLEQSYDEITALCKKQGKY